MLTLEKLKKLIYPLAKNLNLQRVIVSGSYARGEQIAATIPRTRPIVS